MYVLFQVGSKAAVPVASIFLQLTATVVLPLIIGQWIRRYLANFINLKSVPWGQIGRYVYMSLNLCHTLVLFY
jgi:predicted Na+-dependent transporter